MMITADTKTQTSYVVAMIDVTFARSTADTVIDDTTAVTIAAAFAAPHNALATLATTGKVNVARIRADIDRNELALRPGSEDYDADLNALDALRDWVAFKVTDQHG